MLKILEKSEINIATISSAIFRCLPVNIFQKSFLHLVDLGEFSSMRTTDFNLEHGNILKIGPLIKVPILTVYVRKSENSDFSSPF